MDLLSRINAAYSSSSDDDSSSSDEYASYPKEMIKAKTSGNIVELAPEVDVSELE